MKINKSLPVLVTGATGYIAGWVVKNLLDEGIKTISFELIIESNFSATCCGVPNPMKSTLSPFF